MRLDRAQGHVIEDKDGGAGNAPRSVLKATFTLLGQGSASLMAHRVKCLPAMRETWVRSLGWEDPWRRKWQPTPVFLPGESHGRRRLVGYIQSTGSQRVAHD